MVAALNGKRQLIVGGDRSDHLFPSALRHVTIVHGEKHLVFLTNAGRLIILNLESESYEPLASYKVSEKRSWAHLLLSGDLIIIKDESALTCWSLRQVRQ